MSLQYVLDGNNIINHPSFIAFSRKTRDPRASLLDLIKTRRLCGSQRNKIIAVFDGYPYSADLRQIDPQNSIIFSKDLSADEKIRDIVERTPNARNTVVVSDDKEIIFFAKSRRALCLSVEEFIDPPAKHRPKRSKQEGKEEPVMPELTYSQMEQINKELRKKWLK